LLGAINYFYITLKEMPWIAPHLQYASWQSLRRISRTSIPLFLYQVGSLMVNETQMITLAHVTNLRVVSEYSIIGRLSGALTSLIWLGTAAFIPAFREAHERGDVGWIKAGLRRMLLMRLSIAVAIALALIVGGNGLLRVWLHRGDFNFPLSVWIVQGVVLVCATWVVAFSDFLIIMDRIWIQVALVIINGSVTIALTVILAPRLNLLGAYIAIGFVTVFFWTWLLPLLTKRFFAEKISKAL
jgi:O-antigen/teichoic acid export membrane protein